MLLGYGPGCGQALPRSELLATKTLTGSGSLGRSACSNCVFLLLFCCSCYETLGACASCACGDLARVSSYKTHVSLRLRRLVASAIGTTLSSAALWKAAAARVRHQPAWLHFCTPPRTSLHPAVPSNVQHQLAAAVRGTAALRVRATADSGALPAKPQQR